MGHARKAIKALERRGVEGSNITLLGKADEASHRTDDVSNIDRDERVISYTLRSALLGMAIGCVLAGLLGLALGWMVFGWRTGAMWATAGGSVAVGAGLGVLLGAIAGLPQSDAGLAAIENELRGPVELGVEAALESVPSARLHQVDADVRAATRHDDGHTPRLFRPQAVDAIAEPRQAGVGLRRLRPPGWTTAAAAVVAVLAVAAVVVRHRQR
jgi:tetrahydromethanopterin S-methyltransferase subunit F